MAKLEPHAAFIALSKSIQNEWLYVQRVVVDSEYAFIPLQQIIKNLFFPNLSGLEFDNKETDLLCRPTRHLGLGIHDPVKTASNQFTVSKLHLHFSLKQSSLVPPLISLFMKLLSEMEQTKNKSWKSSYKLIH